MRDKIEQLVAEELVRCLELHGGFASHHEAHSVMQEEIEEAEEQLIDISNAHASLWRDIRKGNGIYTSTILEIHGRAIEAAMELVQVSAMSLKWLKLMDKEKAP